MQASALHSAVVVSCRSENRCALTTLDLALTEQVPTRVILDRSVTTGRVVLMELTISWNSSQPSKAAMDRKTERRGGGKR